MRKHRTLFALVATLGLALTAGFAFGGLGSPVFLNSATNKTFPQQIIARYLDTPDGGTVNVGSSAPTATGQSLRSTTTGTNATASWQSDPAATTTAAGIVLIGTSARISATTDTATALTTAATVYGSDALCVLPKATTTAWGVSEFDTVLPNKDGVPSVGSGGLVLQSTHVHPTEGVARTAYYPVGPGGVAPTSLQRTPNGTADTFATTVTSSMADVIPITSTVAATGDPGLLIWPGGAYIVRLWAKADASVAVTMTTRIGAVGYGVVFNATTVVNMTTSYAEFDTYMNGVNPVVLGNNALPVYLRIQMSVASGSNVVTVGIGGSYPTSLVTPWQGFQGCVPGKILQAGTVTQTGTVTSTTTTFTCQNPPSGSSGTSTTTSTTISTAVPQQVFAGIGSSGTATTISAGDHVHTLGANVPTLGMVPVISTSTTLSTGTSTSTNSNINWGYLQEGHVTNLVSDLEGKQPTLPVAKEGQVFVGGTGTATGTATTTTTTITPHDPPWTNTPLATNAIIVGSTGTATASTTVTSAMPADARVSLRPTIQIIARAGTTTAVSTATQCAPGDEMVSLGTTVPNYGMALFAGGTNAGTSTFTSTSPVWSYMNENTIQNLPGDLAGKQASLGTSTQGAMLYNGSTATGTNTTSSPVWGTPPVTSGLGFLYTTTYCNGCSAGTSGVFTKQTNTRWIHMHGWAGGGGGGEAYANGGGEGYGCVAAGGGAQGGWMEAWVDMAGYTTCSVHVGAGGAGGIANTACNNGTIGGNTYVTCNGLTYWARGGNGGVCSSALVNPYGIFAAGGAANFSGDTGNISGGIPGGNGMVFGPCPSQNGNIPMVVSGAGGGPGAGQSVFGAGGVGNGSAGLAATGMMGGGGSGAAVYLQLYDYAGGAGTGGSLVIDEYAN